eukprot:GEMP01065989.1.p1 GENE.GEMP01065989.1~~GEMP01065989.1.p1  ORF type:complete len:198 (+),score=60.92 GEMP01065989.1:177-770(+)
MLSTFFEPHHGVTHHHVTSFEAANTFSTQANLPSSCNDGLHLHIIMTKDSKCGGQGTTMAGGAIAAGKPATDDAVKESGNLPPVPPNEAKVAEGAVAPGTPATNPPAAPPRVPGGPAAAETPATEVAPKETGAPPAAPPKVAEKAGAAAKPTAEPGKSEEPAAGTPKENEVKSGALFLLAPRWENWREQRTEKDDFL